MKKLSKILLALVLSSMVLVGCASKPAEPAAEGKTEEKTEQKVVKIGLVTDTGGVDDKSFNQSAWEGLEKFAKENGDKVSIKYLQSNSDADYVPNLSAFAEEGYDLVIAVGYLFQEAVETVADQYPETNFLFIDSVAEKPNVMSAVYSQEEGSYLVGVAAALKAIENKSKVVGFVGGMEGDLIGAFQAGFEQGVLATCADCKIYVDYADSFVDDAKGQQLAAKQYGAGATIIYQAAGNAGNGVIKEAKERGDVWAIGVDKDQFEDGKKADGKSVVLTSMIKRVDISTYTVATDVLNGNFKAGVLVFNLANDGVGAELTADRNLTAEEIATITKAADAIKAGTIKVDPKPTIKNGATN